MSFIIVGNSELWCFMSHYFYRPLKLAAFIADNFLQPETHLMLHDPTSSLYHVSFLLFCLRVFFNVLESLSYLRVFPRSLGVSSFLT